MSFEDMTNTQLINRYGGTTWERIQDRYLVAAGSNHTVGTTGGSSTVTLTTDNLPSHSHTYSRSSTSTGSHTLTSSEMPYHGHNVQFANKDATKAIFADWSGSGSTSWTIEGLGATNNASNSLTAMPNGGSGGHTHTITRTTVSSGDTGSGTAFSIEHPYIAIYMWRRTA